jgi:hypothetical protein
MNTSTRGLRYATRPARNSHHRVEAYQDGPDPSSSLPVTSVSSAARDGVITCRRSPAEGTCSYDGSMGRARSSVTSA